MTYNESVDTRKCKEMVHKFMETKFENTFLVSQFDDLVYDLIEEAITIHEELMRCKDFSLTAYMCQCMGGGLLSYTCGLLVAMFDIHEYVACSNEEWLDNYLDKAITRVSRMLNGISLETNKDLAMCLIKYLLILGVLVYKYEFDCRFQEGKDNNHDAMYAKVMGRYITDEKFITVTQKFVGIGTSMTADVLGGMKGISPDTVFRTSYHWDAGFTALQYLNLLFKLPVIYHETLLDVINTDSIIVADDIGMQINIALRIKDFRESADSAEIMRSYVVQFINAAHEVLIAYRSLMESNGLRCDSAREDNVHRTVTLPMLGIRVTIPRIPPKEAVKYSEDEEINELWYALVSIPTETFDRKCSQLMKTLRTEHEEIFYSPAMLDVLRSTINKCGENFREASAHIDVHELLKYIKKLPGSEYNDVCSSLIDKLDSVTLYRFPEILETILKVAEAHGYVRPEE